MLRPLFPLALGALLALPVPQALALGFGRASNATMLGQLLDFSVGVRLDGNESLVAECVSAEVYSGENLLPSAVVRVSIDSGVEPGERTLRVTSSAPIDEPVVSVNLQITCPNRLARKFVAFVDPPLINLALPTAPGGALPFSGSAALPGESSAGAVTTAAAPTTAPVARARAKPTPRRQQPAPALNANGAASAALASGLSARAARPGTSAAAATPAPGARLKLEAADDQATRERLSLRLTGTLAPLPEGAGSGAARSAPQVDADAAQRARERERMQALEDSLTRLRAESLATQAGLAQMQLRLREAEAQRFSNPLVFALAALAAALAAAVGVLLWKRQTERHAQAQWWAPGSRTHEAEADAEHEDDASFEWVRPAREPNPGRPGPQAEAAAVVETTASPMMLTQAHALAEAAPDGASPAAAPDHEMSVEELIDLEQQAEFFVVLGQDEAAIDLLMGHLRSSGGSSPLPYLKLLEIYRRRDDHEAYQRIRERFNRRFNAYAQDWQSDPQQGRTLLDYPNVISRLQTLWATPTQAMHAIEASLFRRDAGSSTFDLPAYRELLFLFSVARDLAEREALPASVDLLLPLGSEPAPPLTRLHPTPVAALSLDPPTAVDVDISRLDAGPSRSDDPPSRFHTDFGPTSGY